MENKVEIKIDSAFIDHLREEKLKQQDRRSAYIRAKFTFVIGLFTIAAALSTQSKSETTILWLNIVIYLIPFIAALFDIYILGGEFAVKRIRGFLSRYDDTKTSEKVWDEYLNEWPKAFMKNNRLWTTNTINIIAILFILFNRKIAGASIIEWIWFGIWIVIIIAIGMYLRSIEVLIKKSRGL